MTTDTNMPNDAEIKEAVEGCKDIRLFLKREDHRYSLDTILALAQSYLSGELIPKAGLPTEESLMAMIQNPIYWTGVAGNGTGAGGFPIFKYTEFVKDVAKAIHTRLERNP